MHRRLALVALAVLAVLATVAGTTVAAFSDRASSGATFAAVDSFARFEGLDDASCGGTSDTLTVPAGRSVPPGRTVVAVLGLRGADVTGPVTATDSRGNAYAIDQDVIGTELRTVVVSARPATGLASGDTITFSHPDAASVAGAGWFRYAGTLDATGSDSGTGTSPSATVSTTNAPALIVGTVINTGQHTLSDPAGWIRAGSTRADCGGAGRQVMLSAGYRPEKVPGSWTYAPTIPASEEWIAVVDGYRY